jgi:hypothetical protein
MVEREASFTEVRYEAAESYEASCDPLHLFYVLNQAHLSDGGDLLWVGFDAALGDDEPEQHTARDPKNALFGVEFDVVLLEFREGFFDVSHELPGLFGLDYDVVHVSLDGLSDEIAETFEHTSLVYCSCVL